MKVTTTTVEHTIHRLEQLVACYERAYERSSSDVANGMQDGSIRCTARISKWMINYRALLSLREAVASRA